MLLTGSPGAWPCGMWTFYTLQASSRHSKLDWSPRRSENIKTLIAGGMTRQGSGVGCTGDSGIIDPWSPIFWGLSPCSRLPLSVERGRGHVDVEKAPENSSTEFLGQPARGGSVWRQPSLWRGCQTPLSPGPSCSGQPIATLSGQSLCLASLPAQPELLFLL